jgi:hypothetical protein
MYEVKGFNSRKRQIAFHKTNKPIAINTEDLISFSIRVRYWEIWVSDQLVATIHVVR